MPQLTKQTSIFHRLGLILEEGDFLFLEDSSATLFTLNHEKTLSARLSSSDERTLKIAYYREFHDIVLNIKTSLDLQQKLELSLKEIPQEFYIALEKELPKMSLIPVDGFNLAPSPKDAMIFENCILNIENTLLYFLSILYSTSFDLNRKLELNEIDQDTKRFAMEINRFLESRGSLERKASVQAFKHLESTFVDVQFSFAEGGFIIPFSLMLSLDENPHPFKNHLNALSSTLLKACKEGLFNHLQDLKTFLKHFFEEQNLHYEIHLRCLSTSFDFVRLLEKEGELNEGNSFYLKIVFNEAYSSKEAFFWSNVFVIKNGLLVPQYRTNEVFLEIEI